MQKVGLGFVLGVLAGALATLAFQRLREAQEVDQAEHLAYEIQERLDLLETRSALPGPA